MNKTAFDYSRLLSRMEELKVSAETLSKRIGMPVNTFNKKLQNERAFTVSEADDIAIVLKIEPKDMGSYFFTAMV